jgi:hypothetical protein
MQQFWLDDDSSTARLQRTWIALINMSVKASSVERKARGKTANRTTRDSDFSKRPRHAHVGLCVHQ